MDRDLADVSGQAHGQALRPAAREPGQDVDEAVATLLAQRERLHQRRRLLGLHAERVDVAREHDHDGRRAGPGHRRHQLGLDAGQVEVDGVAGLAPTVASVVRPDSPATTTTVRSASRAAVTAAATPDESSPDTAQPAAYTDPVRTRANS